MPMIRFIGAKVRLSKQNTKEKSIFLLIFQTEVAWSGLKHNVLFFNFGERFNKIVEKVAGGFYGVIGKIAHATAEIAP